VREEGFEPPNGSLPIRLKLFFLLNPSFIYSLVSSGILIYPTIHPKPTNAETP